jgi:hypothetical protein
VKEASADHEFFRRRLDVKDAGTGRHPLRVAVGDDTSAAVGILVFHGAVDHVGDGLEAAMGVPRSAFRLTGGVFDLSHLVEVDERVEIGEVDAAKGSPHGETFPFEAGRPSRHGFHGSVDRVGRRGVEPRQYEWVFNGYGGHFGSFFVVRLFNHVSASQIPSEQQHWHGTASSCVPPRCCDERV